MRLLIVRASWRWPVREDCELMSRVIRCYGRAPRANRRRIPGCSVGAVLVDLLKGLLLVAMSVALVALVLTF
jgi:hypothetical protein